MTKIVVLDSAKADFQEILAGFQRTHSAARLGEFKQSLKSLFAQIKQFPLAGVIPDECVALELVIRQRIAENTRVIYEVRRDTIFIRMFLSTERDFMTHLVERMLRA